MKRFFVCFAVLTAMFLMVCCGGGSDNNSGGGSSNTPVCSYGEYECHGNDSYRCGYSGNDLMWQHSESCSNGCDYYSGRCSSDSNGDSGDNSNGNNSGGDNGNDNSAECTSGKFKCVGNESHYCNSNGSWVYDARCENGCDSSTGKCKTNSGNDDPDTSDSGDNGDSDHGDSSDPDTDSGGGSSVIEQCDVGSFNCKTGSSDGKEYSFRCSNDDFEYHNYETCKAGCDSSTGKCKPWKDPETNLTWSSLKTYSSLTWDEAVSYCNNLSEGGYSNWRLANIDELRTLIQNCPGTVTGGNCKVSEKNDCLSYEECWSSDCSCSNGKYSKLGDTEWFWSSSTMSDDTDKAWSVIFAVGQVAYYTDKTDKYRVGRCVR